MNFRNLNIRIITFHCKFYFISYPELRLFTNNNRSNFEIFDIVVVSEESEMIVVKAQEFWNLVFKIENTEKEYIINELDTHIYFIKRIDNVWKLWDNYIPNSGVLNILIQQKP